jgi:hypothetical protein
MRFVKTIFREIGNDITAFFGLLTSKVALAIAGIISWTGFVFWFAYILEASAGLHPEIAAPVSIFSTLAVTALIYWIATIIIRARKRMKYENTQLLNTIHGSNHDRRKHN